MEEKMKKKVQTQECEQPLKWLLMAPCGFKLCGSESDELTRQQMVGLAADFSAAGMAVSVLNFDEIDERIAERFQNYRREKDLKKIFIKGCGISELDKIDTQIRKVKKATNCSVVIINHISDGMLSDEIVKRLERLAKSCKLHIYFFAQLMWLRKYLAAKVAKKEAAKER
jgi:hypothetical protein